MDADGLTLEKLAARCAAIGSWRLAPGRVGALLLLAVTLLAYIPAIRGGYIWDDDAFVTANAVLRGGLGDLWRIWCDVGATSQYYPMAYSSFWLEYHLFGLWPGASHFINAVLHAANAWLAWRILAELRVPGAALAAFVFALHPVEVESVAWITERKNVLSGTFYLAAILAYFRFDPPAPGDRQPASRPWRYYALAAFLFLCALWSKTVTCSLPAALLLILRWKRARPGWRDLLPLVPLFLLGAGMGLLTGWMEKHVIGARGNDWSLAFPQRLLLAGRALWFYAGKLAWPHPLIFFYPRWTLDPREWWQWLYPAAAAALAGALWRWREVTGKGPLVAVLYFAVTLFPALGFVDVYPFRYSFVADHFQYLASLGLIALAAAGAARAAGRLRILDSLPAPALCVAPLCVLAALSWRQAGMYTDIETLYATTIARNPACWMAHDNLSVMRLKEGRVDEALAHSRRSLEIKPDGAEGWVNLANALAQKGRIVEATSGYERALELRPDFAQAHSDLGNVLLFRGRFDAAVAEYRRAVEIEPGYAEAYNNLGFALLQHDHVDEAIEQFGTALKLQPDYRQARENLQAALARRAALQGAN